MRERLAAGSEHSTLVATNHRNRATPGIRRYLWCAADQSLVWQATFRSSLMSDAVGAATSILFLFAPVCIARHDAYS